MLRMKSWMLAAALAMFLPVGAMAQSVEVSGVKFDAATQVGGRAIVLNGAGTRVRAVFKVYALGLYLPTKTTSADDAIAAAGPKRIHVQMLRDIDANDLGKLLTKGMEANTSRDEFAKSINGVLKLGEMFAQRKRLGTGDYFMIDYVPGTGTTVTINGKPAMDPVKEPEFFQALLKIWLGQNPADAQLKAAMLGEAPPAQTKGPRRGG